MHDRLSDASARSMPVLAYPGFGEPLYNIYAFRQIPSKFMTRDLAIALSILKASW